MYVKMYRGPDPVVEGEDSFMAVMNGKSVAPCAVNDVTERYWATHAGFAELIRWMQKTRGNAAIEQLGVPIASSPAQRALHNAELLWEGLV
jgi:hypothetical protein